MIEKKHNLSDAVKSGSRQIQPDNRKQQLECIYRFGELVETSGKDKEFILDKLPVLLHESFPNPGTVGIRLFFQGKEYSSGEYNKEQEPEFSVLLNYYGEPAGCIEVFSPQSLEEDSSQTEKLLHAIAERLSMVLERFEAEKDNVRSEQYYNYLFDNANDAIFLHRYGNIVKTNNAASTLLGYSQASLSSMTLQDIVYDCSDDVLAKAMEEIKSTGVFSGKTWFRRKDGEKRFVQVRSKLIDSDEGLILGIVRDITEEQEESEKLKNRIWETKRSQRLLQALYSSSMALLEDDNFVHVFRDIFSAAKRTIEAESGFIAVVNKDDSSVKILGIQIQNEWKVTELEKSFTEIGSLQTVIEESEIRIENNGEGFNIRNCFSSASAHFQIENCMIVPIKLHGAVEAVMAFVNRPEGFSDRQKSEALAFADLIAVGLMNSENLEYLKKREAHFRRLFTESASTMLLIDPDTGKIMDANKSAQEYYGYTLEELKNMYISEINTLSREEVKKEMAAAVSKERTFFQFKHKLKNGEIRDVEEYSGTISQDDPFLYSIIHDVTELIEFEEKLKSSVKEKEVLLREIHHRLKNNLSVIIALMNYQKKHTQNSEVEEILTHTEERIRSIALIHELLYSSGNLSAVDMRAYVQRLVSNIRTTMSTDKSVRFVTEAEQYELDLDRVKACGLIITELCTNSLKHAFKTEGTITVQFWKDDDYFLRVADNGTGIEATDDEMPSQHSGLFLVRLLTKELKGSLDLESDGGTSVTIRFSGPEKDS
ncbi:MAG: PAS domain S-box protein [Spirochaetia bacterium]